MTNYRMAKLYQLIAFLVLITPLAVLAIINHKVYFKTPGCIFSLTGFILIFYAIIGFKSKFKEFATQEYSTHL